MILLTVQKVQISKYIYEVAQNLFNKIIIAEKLQHFKTLKTF